MPATPQIDAEEDRSGLLKLAVAGLAVGALAGLVGSAFHFVVDRADALRDALVAWSHAAPWIGWLAPVGLAAAAAFVARWLVRRFAPEARAAACSASRRLSAATRALRAPRCCRSSSSAACSRSARASRSAAKGRPCR